ncbi:MAG: sensor histidine kinase, partial [Paenibacillaceae bacterium]
PIVENAVKYGLEAEIGDEWHVRIICARIGDTVVITVRDNGAGIVPERLSRLQRQLQASHDPVWENEERIGLRNVNARIRMHFGPPYGVWIDSMRGEGTTVTVTIPYSTKDGMNGDQDSSGR